ncbi:GTPase Era [Enterobacteriaceae endosymbiont of Donacia clavipes]|nr:GTPase Era [Enterobacteriaceae endosymbiont of Donacia clavipes]
MYVKITFSYYGKILILGRSNVGKSTLINTLIGKKISIISHKINTTNFNIVGIYNNNSYQIEYIDTPGNIFFNKINFNLLINNKFNFILFVLDRNKWNHIEKKILEILNKINIPIILIINKVDKIKNKNILLPYINSIKKKIKFIFLFIISAKYKLYTDVINNFICKNLPKKKHRYPKNYITNQTKEIIIKEIIRENIIKYIHKELPYLINIKINNILKEKIKKNEIKILFLVKNLNQKKIIIGKKAKKLKLIKYQSEQNIENFFKKKINLKIWVQIK